jgi:hypothetical protein
MSMSSGSSIPIRIYNLLSNKNYYSLSLNYVASILNIPIRYLRLFDSQSGNHRSLTFQKRFNDHINIFIYNDVEYIGLESRRIDYERDMINGTNWVEDAIAAGYYS